MPAGAYLSRWQATGDEPTSTVVLARGPDRPARIKAVIESLGGIHCQGKDIFIKASFNSPHPFPATTHPKTIEGLVRYLRENRCAGITLAERSGMGTARDIWGRLGVLELANRLNVNLVSLDDLPAGEWRHEELPGSHWKRGVDVPRFLGKGQTWIQICNLKTHRFGGRFSASLKNSVGLIAKYSPEALRYNYMAELHASPDQRLMIAEINQLYSPDFVLMDATEVFIDGGPESGEIAAPGIIAASRDRVALDAVGLALLRLNSPAPPFSQTPVFEEDQLKRAAELGLGAKSADEVLVKPMDPADGNLSLQIKGILSHTSDEKKR